MPCVPPFSHLPASDALDVSDDVRRLFEELATALPPEERAASGECRPHVDVLETDRYMEVVVDVPGVSAAALRIAFRNDVLLIVGEKAAPRAAAAQAYHLVEREFGRFVRAIRLTGAFDAGSARARIENGALSIVLPKITDRRGRVQTIPIDVPPATAP